MECLEGARRVTVNMYSPISKVQRERVFGMGMAEMKEIAVEAATLMQELKKEGMRFEYTAESFTVAEPEFALDVCNGILFYVLLGH
jgi:2-isopropylmalate synthase